MPTIVKASTLSAKTVDILNVIRANAGYNYQSSVPVIETEHDIPKVGERIYGNPELKNEFLHALVNRIALVAVKSVTFNNPYAALKKGYLEFGETVEDIFVDLAKAVDYSAEKAPSREFKRTLPKTLSVFYNINFRAMYPITIQDKELKRAFLSADGVTNLISKIVQSVYNAAQLDEYLLFKYVLIKSITRGALKPVSVGSTATEMAKKFRGVSNQFLFPSTEFTEFAVTNNCDRENQIIFMDALTDAEFDVDVLSAAFNMDKAAYQAQRYLIDNWTSFDNTRFEVIRANSDGLEEVTSAELSLMEDVKAVLIDKDFFQFYDNENEMTQTYAASGLYYNYFFHKWMTCATSPFVNAVVFVSEDATITLPNSITVKITGKQEDAGATVFTLEPQFESATLKPSNVTFIQTEDAVEATVAIDPKGIVMFPASASAAEITLEAHIGTTAYTAGSDLTISSSVGDTITLTK